MGHAVETDAAAVTTLSPRWTGSIANDNHSSSHSHLRSAVSIPGHVTTSIVLFLQVGKLRHKVILVLAQGHKAVQ